MGTHSTIRVMVGKNGKPTKVIIDPRGELDHLIFVLDRKIIPALKELSKDDAAVADECARLKNDVDYLEAHVIQLGFEKSVKGNVQMVYETRTLQGEDEQAVTARVSSILSSHSIRDAIEYILTERKKPKASKPKEHKQSKSLAKTVAKITGRDTEQQSLFALPLQELKQELERQQSASVDGLLTKNVMSLKTGILAQVLVSKYSTQQKDDEGFIAIDDISALAGEVNTYTQELKYLLLLLGGYQYWHIVNYEHEIGYRTAKLFDLEVLYDKDRAEGGKIDMAGEISASNMMTIIKNERIKCLKVRLTREFIRDIEGKRGALGYFTARDGFLATCNELSLWAYKIINFSATNRPHNYKIGEDKLFKHIGILDHVKRQGRPRMQKLIMGAMDELVQKGHFTEYKIEEGDTGLMYSWTCSDKYFKHSKKPEAEYVDQKDKTIDVAIRRENLANWMMKNRGISAQKAREHAEKSIPE